MPKAEGNDEIWSKIPAPLEGCNLAAGVFGFEELLAFGSFVMPSGLVKR